MLVFLTRQDRGGDLDVDVVVRKLRLARNHMVQTEVWYHPGTLVQYKKYQIT